MNFRVITWHVECPPVKRDVKALAVSRYEKRRNTLGGTIFTRRSCKNHIYFCGEGQAIETFLTVNYPIIANPACRGLQEGGCAAVAWFREPESDFNLTSDVAVEILFFLFGRTIFLQY